MYSVQTNLPSNKVNAETIAIKLILIHSLASSEVMFTTMKALVSIYPDEWSDKRVQRSIDKTSRSHHH